MMTKLVSLSKKSIIHSVIIRVFVYISTKMISFYYEVSGWIRIHFGIKTRFDNIRCLKNLYEGERCFIICTGPSLQISDVEQLNNEYTFGMNALCLLHDKTRFRPTFYCCTDQLVYKRFEDEIIKFSCGVQQTFISDRIWRNKKVPTNWSVLPLNIAYHTYDRWFKKKYWCKFSDNAFRVVYDMYSVTHSLIQLAVYMGFNKIYLLGADCFFPRDEKSHFIEYGTLDPDYDSAEERCLAGYEEVKRYMASHEVELINATRGGNLEMFERRSLEEILNKSDSNPKE